MSLNGSWSVVLYYGLIVVLNKDQIGSDSGPGFKNEVKVFSVVRTLLGDVGEAAGLMG